MRLSTKVLQECIDVQEKKAKDYQNAASSVVQADYYLNGVQTIYDTMHGKMLRIRSIQETILNDPSFTPNHESLRDSVIDLINYASFYAAYLDHGIPGQDPSRDIFNRPPAKDVGEIVVSGIDGRVEDRVAMLYDDSPFSRGVRNAKSI